MGHDKSNVRFVIHYQILKILEAYYQEAVVQDEMGLPKRCNFIIPHHKIVQIQYYLLSNQDMDEEHGKKLEYTKR